MESVGSKITDYHRGNLGFPYVFIREIVEKSYKNILFFNDISAKKYRKSLKVKPLRTFSIKKNNTN